MVRARTYAGERLAVRLFVTRTGTHSAAASLLLLYAVYDGSVVYTHTWPDAPAPPKQTSSMLWIPWTMPRVRSQALQMLDTLAPLPELVPVQTTSHAHGMRARPMARTPPTAPLPSSRIAKGEGVLATLPALAHPPSQGKDETEWSTSLLYIADGSGALHVFLDGTVWVGTTDVAAPDTLEQAVLVHASLSDTTLLVESASNAQAVHVALPMANGESRTTGAVHLAMVSTTLQQTLAQALDACHHAGMAWNSVARPRAMEWHAQLDDLARRYATNMGLEMMMLVMTGRATPAVEQLLLHNLTEGVRTCADKGHDCDGAGCTAWAQADSAVRGHDHCACV